MYEKSYGKGMSKGSDDGYVVPGSPDSRRKRAYSGDMYDEMSYGYGKKVSTKKNKTGTAGLNSGIQGDGGGNVTKDASTYGQRKSYRSDYGGAAGKTSKGKPEQHKVKRHRTKR